MIWHRERIYVNKQQFGVNFSFFVRNLGVLVSCQFLSYTTSNYITKHSILCQCCFNITQEIKRILLNTDFLFSLWKVFYQQRFRVLSQQSFCTVLNEYCKLKIEKQPHKLVLSLVFYYKNTFRSGLDEIHLKVLEKILQDNCKTSHSLMV